MLDPPDRGSELVDPGNALRFSVVHIDVDEVFADADSAEPDSVETLEDSVSEVRVLGFDVGSHIEVGHEMRAIFLSADGFIVLFASGSAIDNERDLSVVSGFLEFFDEAYPGVGNKDLAAAAASELVIAKMLGALHSWSS
jgi:hypothetical protein